MLCSVDLSVSAIRFSRAAIRLFAMSKCGLAGGTVPFEAAVRLPRFPLALAVLDRLSSWREAAALGLLPRGVRVDLWAVG